MEGPLSHWEEKHHVLILGGSEIIHFAVSVPWPTLFWFPEFSFPFSVLVYSSSFIDFPPYTFLLCIHYHSLPSALPFFAHSFLLANDYA